MTIVDGGEEQRLAAVHRYNVLDTPPDQAFDRVSALASRVCNAPVAIVSIVDADRIWFKSHHGVDVDQVDRDPGLCASAILQGDPWIVEDARTDPRTLANPLVAGELGLQFYLGIPLRTSDGHNLGVLCVLDFEPRSASEREILDLTDLASVVVDELELRLAFSRQVALETELRAQAEDLARNLQTSLLPATLPDLDGLELAAEYRPAHRERVGGDFYDAFETRDGYGLLIGDVCGHGPRAAALASMARHSLRAVTVSTDWEPSRLLADLNAAVLVTPEDDDRRFCTVALLRCRRDGSAVAATIALGGHPYPRILRADGSVEVVGQGGSLIGVFASAAFTDADLRLEPGDALVLYTDGLVEAEASAEHHEARVLDDVLAGLKGASAAVIVEALIAAVAASTPTPRDDIAVLVARNPWSMSPAGTMASRV